MPPSADANVTIQVFHNVAFDGTPPLGYLPGDRVVEVFRATALADRGHLFVCKLVYDLLTTGHEPEVGPADIRAVAYRARGNRSLSFGDIVAVDGTFYARLHVGFFRISPPKTTTEGRPGSTPHNEPEPGQPIGMCACGESLRLASSTTKLCSRCLATLRHLVLDFVTHADDCMTGESDVDEFTRRLRRYWPTLEDPENAAQEAIDDLARAGEIVETRPGRHAPTGDQISQQP
jgi:hypothetical protein